MAILPGAIVKIVERHDTLRTRQRGFCLHIAVSNGASLFNQFNTPGEATSHFYVRKTGNTKGMADYEQYVDTKFRAPANLEGNPTLISLETQGGVGKDLDAGWTATQRERIAWILAQCNKIHGTPLHAMPNSLPGSTGVGYHRQGVDPYRVYGGEHWSTSYGKVCPGTARMAQIPSIIARAKQLVAPPVPPPPPPLEDDMFTDADRTWIEGRIQAYSAFNARHVDQIEATTAGDVDLILKDDFANLQASINELRAAVVALTAALPPKES